MGEVSGDDYTRSADVLIANLAVLISGLHVPVSLGLPLGDALTAYTAIRERIGDFGWTTAGEIEARLRLALGYKARRQSYGGQQEADRLGRVIGKGW
jgi:hypothetical protein